jgi:hypothetical protein
MASLWPGDYVVILLTVGGSKASDIKLVLHREPRTSKTLFLVGSTLRDEEHINVVVRKLYGHIGNIEVWIITWLNYEVTGVTSDVTSVTSDVKSPLTVQAPTRARTVKCPHTI